MATKQKDNTEEAIGGQLLSERDQVVRKESEQTFDERTQELQPWAGSEGVDDARPAPSIEEPTKTKEEK